MLFILILKEIDLGFCATNKLLGYHHTTKLINMHEHPQGLCCWVSREAPSLIWVTCHPGIATFPLRRLALSVLFTLQSTSYQTTCTVSERPSIKAHANANLHRVVLSHYDSRRKILSGFACNIHNRAHFC